MLVMDMNQKQINEVLDSPDKALKLNEEQLDAVTQPSRAALSKLPGSC
jgi:hypothetical protein